MWSFGVVLWEIFTFCDAKPYCEFDTKKDVLDFLNDGKRMKIPSNCPSKIAAMMQECWNEQPSSRPSFSNLAKDLQEIVCPKDITYS